jgi:hypothetical protein
MRRREVEESCIMKKFTIRFAKHNQNSQDKETELGKACSMSAEHRNVHMVVVGKSERKKTTRKTKTKVGGYY